MRLPGRRRESGADDGSTPAERGEPGEANETDVLAELRPDGAPALSPDARRSAAQARTPVNRTVWVMAIVAVVSLAAGIVLSRFVISPAQAAAEVAPPEAGPITVEVERRALSSDVVARGDAVYDDAVSLTIETGDLGGPAVVTGAVPEVGAEVAAGRVLLEIAGRPVVVLPGDLPVYRTLRSGVSGPDVVQLQGALASLGIDGGSSGTYDAATADAVAQLFTQAGYPAPEPPEGSREALTAAEEGVRSAEDALAQARAAVTQVGRGATSSERIAADNAVNAAQRTLDDATSCANAAAPIDPETGQALPKEPCATSVADAQDALRLAKAQRDEALAAPDTSAEIASRDAAERALGDAQAALAQAQQDVLTPLPASEVAFVANLPRRVDSVAVQRGSTINGPVMSISGATVEIVANVADADAALLAVGQGASLAVGEETLPATIAEINATPTRGAAATGGGDGQDSTASGRTEVVLHPTELTEEQRTALVGTNVRVTIPVSSTAGEVLAVPIAALTAGAGGETRVEVLRDGATTPELVVVTLGLSAEGYAEITSSEAPLAEGDLVVVGQSDGASGGTSDDASGGAG
ncbi:hypothetical protein [Miniimonas sp. S16]|uniref:hypothetical protein n=1 Tax=Miniimonas sp. S16 TaxID=2171623 RepID=UPI001F482579|nr:hypothetical protein [Miniimonas sp. S16]